MEDVLYGGAAAGLGLGTMLIILLVSCIIGGIPYFFMARKAGIDHAWLSFTPLSFIILFKLIGKSAWNFLIIFIPFVGIVFSIIWMVDLLRAFDRNPAMILAMLFIPGFSFFYMIYLGVSDNVEYVY